MGTLYFRGCDGLLNGESKKSFITVVTYYGCNDKDKCNSGEMFKNDWLINTVFLIFSIIFTKAF